jgi:hypothetical protein
MLSAVVQASELAAIEEAIYDDSFRTITEQAKVLDGVRTRAGTLVAVANVATAFLGGLALSGGDPQGLGADAATLGALEWIAIACFIASFALAVGILMPSRNWVFFHDPRSLLGVYVDPGPPVALSEFRRSIAYYNGVHYEANARRLRKLGGLLWSASLLLAAEIVLWIVVLAN